MDTLKPLAIFLVAQGDTKGDRMLFKYPIGDEHEADCNLSRVSKLHKNPYGLVSGSEDVFITSSRKNCQSCIVDGMLSGLSERILAFIFTAKPEMCGQKFEVKINDVRFLSHPILLPSASKTPHNSGNSHSGDTASLNRFNGDVMPNILIFNVVFALRAEASRSVSMCFHDLSKRLGLALKHEELRCGYLSNETKIMVECHEEVPTLPEDSKQSAYKLILQKSQLARDLVSVFNDVCEIGRVHLYINRFIEVSFCLPQKVHQFQGLIIEPIDIERCFAALRPYHGMLLLEDASAVIDSLQLDASPALIRLLKVYHPSRSLQVTSIEADLPLSQIFQLVGHLVYWGKATVIYPLCETNVYLISPSIDLSNHRLCEQFGEHFPNENLWLTLSEFSLPTSLIEFTCQRAFDPHEQTQRAQVISWLLRHHLLMQLYTYVYIAVNQNCEDDFSFQTESTTTFDTSVNLSGVTLRSTPDFYADEHDPAVLDRLLKAELMKYLTPLEYKIILRSPGAQNIEDLALFTRLCTYFRGQHPVEEMMYCENLKRSQISTLIGKFHDVLITCIHEDALEAALHHQL